MIMIVEHSCTFVSCVSPTRQRPIVLDGLRLQSHYNIMVKFLNSKYLDLYGPQQGSSILGETQTSSWTQHKEKPKSSGNTPFLMRRSHFKFICKNNNKNPKREKNGFKCKPFRIWKLKDSAVMEPNGHLMCHRVHL